MFVYWRKSYVKDSPVNIGKTEKHFFEFETFKYTYQRENYKKLWMLILKAHNIYVEDYGSTKAFMIYWT